jgi:bacteriocin biosynthesis cyclodehydratase domain-containing protein
LLSDAPAPTAPAVAIAGSGPTAQRIASALGLAGVRVSLGATVSEQDCDVGIAIGHYVLDPDSYGFWLRRDRPHLAVVFGDDSVTMGPVVEPGHTPCLYCLEHYRRDDDASWPAIASQLWGRRSTSETPLVSAEVAVRVTRMVLNRLEHGSVIRHSAAARSFRLAVDTGEVTRREWMPHPDCGCIRLPPLPTGEPVSEDRRESGSPRGLDRPTTVAGAAGPA